MADGNINASRLNFLDLLFSFSIDCFFGTLIALGEPVLVVHPDWIAEMVRVLVVLVHNPDPFIESPHGIVHFETEFIPQTDMILKRRGQIAQHGVILGGKAQ